MLDIKKFQDHRGIFKIKNYSLVLSIIIFVNLSCEDKIIKKESVVLNKKTEDNKFVKITVEHKKPNYEFINIPYAELDLISFTTCECKNINDDKYDNLKEINIHFPSNLKKIEFGKTKYIECELRKEINNIQTYEKINEGKIIIEELNSNVFEVEIKLKDFIYSGIVLKNRYNKMVYKR